MKRSHLGFAVLLGAVAFGLTSCGNRMPSQPAAGNGGPPVGGAAVTEASLQTNELRWSSSHLDSYRYRFHWSCYCTPDQVRLVDVTVVHGAVTSVTDANTGEALDAVAASRYGTIETLFEFVRSAILRPADAVNGSFDPGLGYPTAIFVDDKAGIADDETAFRIESLVALNPWGSESRSVAGR